MHKDLVALTTTVSRRLIGSSIRLPKPGWKCPGRSSTSRLPKKRSRRLARTSTLLQLAAVRKDADEGLAVARAAEAAGHKAMAERDYRQRGLLSRSSSSSARSRRSCTRSADEGRPLISASHFRHPEPSRRRARSFIRKKITGVTTSTWIVDGDHSADDRGRDRPHDLGSRPGGPERGASDRDRRRDRHQLRAQAEHRALLRRGPDVLASERPVGKAGGRAPRGGRSTITTPVSTATP